MGSSKIADNSAIWASVIKNRTTDEDILWLIEHAMREIELISKARNDFIHSVFSRTYPAFWFIFPAHQTVARRVTNESPRSITDLPSMIDQAARLSCLVAHIDHLVGGNSEATSTWLENSAQHFLLVLIRPQNARPKLSAAGGHHLLGDFDPFFKNPHKRIHVGLVQHLRHLKNFLAFCLSVRGFTRLSIGQPLALCAFDCGGRTFRVADLARVPLVIPFA